MSIPTDVFNDVILSYVPMNVARYYRDTAPDTYVQRAEQKNDRFSRLLVAVANDDIKLFASAAFHSENNDNALLRFMVHLVFNIAANPKSTAVPTKIVDLLLTQEIMTIYDHLSRDYQFFATNLNNTGLLSRIFKSLSFYNGAWSVRGNPDTMIANVQRDIVQIKQDEQNGENSHLVTYFPLYLGHLAGYMSRDLIAEAYSQPDLGELTQDQRTNLFREYNEVVNLLWRYRAYQTFEEIKSLNPDDIVPHRDANFETLFFRRMHSLEYAYLWHNALNDPVNYPELVRKLKHSDPPISRSYVEEYLDTIGNSIVRPDLFVDAIFEYIRPHDQPIDDDIDTTAYLIFLIMNVMGIPYIGEIGDEVEFNEEDEIYNAGMPFNQNTRRQVAQAVLAHFPYKFNLCNVDGVETECPHVFTQYYDQIVALANQT
jgi:hypothetical protein